MRGPDKVVGQDGAVIVVHGPDGDDGMRSFNGALRAELSAQTDPTAHTAPTELSAYAALIEMPAQTEPTAYAAPTELSAYAARRIAGDTIGGDIV